MIQNIIVALIIFAALIYAGSMARQKLRSFKPKPGACGAGCGCEKAAK